MLRIPIKKRRFSIYGQKRSVGKCELCGKIRLCYEIPEMDIDEEGHPDISGFIWTCKKCMIGDQYEYYFG